MAHDDVRRTSRTPARASVRAVPAVVLALLATLLAAVTAPSASASPVRAASTASGAPAPLPVTGTATGTTGTARTARVQRPGAPATSSTRTAPGDVVPDDRPQNVASSGGSGPDGAHHVHLPHTALPPHTAAPAPPGGSVRLHRPDGTVPPGHVVVPAHGRSPPPDAAPRPA